MNISIKVNGFQYVLGVQLFADVFEDNGELKVMVYPRVMYVRDMNDTVVADNPEDAFLWCEAHCVTEKDVMNISINRKKLE